MAVYHTVNENISRIRDFIFSNDRVKRYLFYNEDPLDTSKPEPTVDEINLNHLYPYPNNPTPEDNAISFINVYMFRGSRAGNNTIHRNIQIFVDILCHEELWLLDDGSGLTRPLEILDILDTNLPTIVTPSIRGELAFVDSPYIQYNNKFCGYRLIYEITNFSEGCLDV